METKAIAVTNPGQAISIQDIERMAIAFAKSGLFGIKTPEQGVALMLISQAEGLHPAIAARDFHIIQGRAALKADAFLARFQVAGGKVVWNAYADDRVSGTFSHPQGGTVTVEWTIAQAKAAGLTGKDVWKQYPRAMLRARVISEGIRTVYPGVAVGVYTPEEIEDFDTKPATKEVKAEPVQAAPKAPETVVEVVAEQPKPVTPKPKVTIDPERGAAMNELKKSSWSRDQLTEYAQVMFGVDSSAKLATPQLKILAQVALGDFDTAMNEAFAVSSSQNAPIEQDLPL